MKYDILSIPDAVSADFECFLGFELYECNISFRGKNNSCKSWILLRIDGDISITLSLAEGLNEGAGNLQWLRVSILLSLISKSYVEFIFSITHGAMCSHSGTYHSSQLFLVFPYGKVCVF